MKENSPMGPIPTQRVLVLSDIKQESVEMSVPVSADMWFGYKFMGDNIDKNIMPRFQQQECQAGQSTLFSWL